MACRLWSRARSLLVRGSSLVWHTGVIHVGLAYARLQVELLRLDLIVKLLRVGRLWPRGRPLHVGVGELAGRPRRRLQVHQLVGQRVAHGAIRRKPGVGLRDVSAEALSERDVTVLLLHVAALTAQAYERAPLTSAARHSRGLAGRGSGAPPAPNLLRVLGGAWRPAPVRAPFRGVGFRPVRLHAMLRLGVRHAALELLARRKQPRNSGNGGNKNALGEPSPNAARARTQAAANI